MVERESEAWEQWVEPKASPGAATAAAPGERTGLELPMFTLAERDRRWARVRELMRRDGIDVIVAPDHTGMWDQFQANVRYLTCIGGNSCPAAAVFPLDGEVTAIPGPTHTGYWLEFQNWVSDVRPTFFDFTTVIIERLRELGADDLRIGISGLAGNARAPEGLITHRAYERIREAFPNAELVNATFLMDEARFVKSNEEIAFMQHAVRITETALEVLATEAKAGVPERVVYGRMLGRMVEEGSEPTTMFLWAAGTPHPPGILLVPTGRELQTGDFILTEIEARWAGYIGQVTQSAVVGKASAELTEIFELQQEALRRCFERLRPGARLREFATIAEEVAAGTPYDCRVIIHSRGLGDDSPVIVFGTQDARMLDWELEENAVLTVKPQVKKANGEKAIYWGDTVVVTKDGARRLGTRVPELMELG